MSCQSVDPGFAFSCRITLAGAGGLGFRRPGTVHQRYESDIADPAQPTPANSLAPCTHDAGHESLLRDPLPKAFFALGKTPTTRSWVNEIDGYNTALFDSDAHELARG